MLPLPAADLADFAPMAERALAADDAVLLRLRSAGQSRVSGFVRLPYEVLAGRTIALESVAIEAAASFDVTVAAEEFLRWLAGSTSTMSAKDAHWLAPLPPASGWQRVEVVPDTEVREVVRRGAELAPSATTRTGQQSLLSAVVLTASSAARTVDVPLGPLSGLTKLGFLPRGGSVAVDVAPGWIRVAAAFGSTYVSDGNPLGLLSL